MSGSHASGTEAVVQACYAAWSERSVDGVLGHLSDDCVYTMHLPVDVLAFAGRHVGKSAIGGCLHAILEEFSFVAYAVDWLTVDGETARARVVYYYRHNENGDQLEGFMRHVWRVVDGRVTSLDEYHDVGMMKAFLEMVRGLRIS